MGTSESSVNLHIIKFPNLAGGPLEDCQFQLDLKYFQDENNKIEE